MEPTMRAPAREGPDLRRVMLVTGLSGAGMSTALKALEDIGYEAVDNLPIALAHVLVEQSHRFGPPLAIGIDSRTRDFSTDALLGYVGHLRAQPETEVQLIFVDCDAEVLQRRFTETRRRHPLAVDRPVSDGIRRERILLYPVRDHADLVIDTSLLNIHQLRRLLDQHCSVVSDNLYVFVTSFSFRRGVPREADLVFDVRFLTNPHWREDLRPLTGLDREVQELIATDRDFGPFMEHLRGLLRTVLPRYNLERKSYLTIAVGCTGGRHRSVFVAEHLAAWLREEHHKVGLLHRDIPRSDPEGS